MRPETKYTLKHLATTLFKNALMVCGVIYLLTKLIKL